MSTIAQLVIRSCDRRVLEIEQVKAWLVGNGFQLSDNDWSVDSKADLIIFTTCGVTQLHEDFTFEMLEKIKHEKKPGAMLVLGGCVPEINPQRVAEEFGGPTFSPKSYERLDAILQLPRKLDTFERPHTDQTYTSYRTDVGNILGFARSLKGHWLDYRYCYRKLFHAVESRLHRQRTFLIQIHEGCSMGCSYCAIQKAIGPLRNSKPVDTILKEINAGLEQGYQCIRLIGDSAGSYGLDIKTNIGELLKQIAQVKRDFHLELTDINPVFLPVMFEPALELCRQKRLSSLYIPIQSGSDRILDLMHRRSKTSKTRQMLREIKTMAPRGFKLGTSVIVGFPSESEEDFNETVQLCNDVGFDWVWCHGFSPRPGTPACDLPGQLSKEQVFERVDRFRASILKKESVILDLQ